jgi:adenylate kinase family enzyme
LHWRYAIFGNSGSGKSTLAKRLHTSTGATLLDLDSIYWAPAASGAGDVPTPRPLADVLAELDRFLAANPNWIIEGCYGELIEHALSRNPVLVLVDPGVEVCLRNCREREWEGHKYASKAEQDTKLPALLEWVRAYENRTDTMSRAYHERVFQSYDGSKIRVKSSDEFES